MESARCTIDGFEYLALKFDALPPDEKAQKRRHLVCVRCGTGAYFRSRSSSGQAACFGARPHANCSLAAPEAVKGAGLGADRDPLANPGDHIVLDLAFGASEHVHNPVNQNGDEGAGGRGGRHVGTGGVRAARSHKRLRPLLRTLIYLESFRSSTKTIEIPDRGSYEARKLFIEFSEASKANAGRFKGFFGVIYDCGYGYDGTLWLNTGELEDLSIAIDEQDVKAFLERFDIESLTDLEGMHILVFGFMRVAMGSGKLVVNPAAMNLIALCND